MLVYVLDKNGQPLMPTERCGKVRRLLKSKQVKVVRRCPFTIQLLYNTTELTQPVTLGVDTGIVHIGMCASTANRVLYQSETLQRKDVSDNISARREFRRTRRNRKMRYRKPRFDNRVHAKHKGWLAPSVEQLISVHLSEMRFVCKLLPVTKIRIETAEFDIHKIKDPTVSGVDYQFGEKYGFEQNTRNYVLFRDNHKCRFCGNTKGKIYVCAADGRQTVAPEDLYTFCESCYRDLCKGIVKIPKRRYFAPPTKMGIMRDTLMRRAAEMFSIPVEQTTGAETKALREANGIVKSHINDAFCITKNINAQKSDCYYLRRKVRCHNRQIHKATISKGGYRKLSQCPYEVKGFRLYDRVIAHGKEWYIHGRRLKGSFVIKTLDGDTLEIVPSKILRVNSQHGFITERRPA